MTPGERSVKIVYAGPGLGGKSTNLRCIHDQSPPDRRGQLVSLADDEERTLFFDFLPLDLGRIGGHPCRLRLYTVPGQNRLRVNQALILRGADGIVFVADSHPMRRDANCRSLTAVEEILADEGRTLAASATAAHEVPIVMQYNKRDLARRLPLDELESDLNPRGAAFVPAVAVDGRGVRETLKEIARRTLARSAPPATTHG